MSKSQHPHGKGKTSLSSTLPNEVLEALDYLATKSGLTRSSYAREAITEAVLTGRIYSSQEIMAKRYNIGEAPASPLVKETPGGPPTERKIGFHAKKNNNGPTGAFHHSNQTRRRATS